VTTGAIKFEDYSILVRSGDVVIKDLALTGWGAYASDTPALRTWADSGRMWGRITAADEFELFRDDALGSSDRVCNGTISGGAVTLAQDNTSGISGSVNIPSHTSGDIHLFDVVVSYADESDLLTVYPQVDKELDDNNKFEGQASRFEWLFRDVKRTMLDPFIWARIKDEVGTDKLGRPRLGYLSDPRQLSRVHALLCAARLVERRISTLGQGQFETIEGAKNLRKQAIEEFNNLPLGVDSNRDDILDGIAKPGSIVIRRG
jgi:hypothetical protein